MTISSTTNRVSFTGNGVTRAFSFPYFLIAKADLKVYLAGALKTLDTHYTITGTPPKGPWPDGVTVTFPADVGAAPASDASIVILRDPSITQGTDYVENDSLPIETVEQTLDRGIMIAQRLSERIDRAFTLPDTDVSGASTELPTPEASTLIGWNSDGDALQNYSAGELNAAILVSSFMEAVLDDATAADARTTLDVPSTSEAILDTIIDAKGDLIVGTAADTVARKAVGADGKVLMAEAAQADGMAWSDVPLPRSYVSGLMQSQAADTDHDTTISAGEARDSTDAYNLILTAAITKRIDAAWAVGTGNGGLDGSESVGGTPDASTWYYVWLIARSDTGVVDVLYSESATAPTMPADYDFKRLIIRTSATGTIRARADVATMDGYQVVTYGFEWSRR